MTRLPTKLADVDRRMPEAGRIRLGVKTAKGMTSIDTFRFTSPDRSVLDELAALYGGQVKPWSDPKASPPNQFEVITQANEIDVYLPTGALSCWYEMWSGGGVERRCDGETCQVPITTPGGWEMDDQPCLCVRNNNMQCRPYTRLNVIIPSVSFRGVWRLETKGWNAQHELPGMVDIIETMTNAGQLVHAKLNVQRRTQQTKAGKRNFVVPGITLAHSPQQMLEGSAAVGALNAPLPAPVAALPPAPVSTHDDGIIDAEIVADPLEDRVYEIAAQLRINGDQLWRGISLRAGTDDDRPTKIANAISAMEAGSHVPIGFNPDGSIIWKKA